MSLICPECNSYFPKFQKNCIPYSICNWFSVTKIMPPGTREDANMFCTECNTNFVATRSSYNKLLLNTYIITLLFIIVPISIIFLLDYPGINMLYTLIAGGVLRVLIPQIMCASVIELEETPLKELF